MKIQEDDLSATDKFVMPFRLPQQNALQKTTPRSGRADLYSARQYQSAQLKSPISSEKKLARDLNLEVNASSDNNEVEPPAIMIQAACNNGGEWDSQLEVDNSVQLPNL